MLFASDGAPLVRGLGYLSALADEDRVIVGIEGRELTRSSAHGDVLESVALDQDALCLATARADAYAVGLKWDASAKGTALIGHGAERRVVKVLDEYEVSSIAISRDGARVAAGGYVSPVGPRGGVRLFTRGEPEGLELPFKPPVSRHGIAFSPAGDRLAAIAPDMTVRITDLEQPSRYWELTLAEKAKAWSVRAHDGTAAGSDRGLLAEALGAGLR